MIPDHHVLRYFEWLTDASLIYVRSQALQASVLMGTRISESEEAMLQRAKRFETYILTGNVKTERW